MLKFSANLGFLWTELSLPDAIIEAHRSGFDAVECHFPYSTPTQDVNAALAQTGLRMIGVNTWPGDLESGDFGLCALPDRKGEARDTIRQSIDYAAAIKAKSVHVMAGKISGPAAHDTLVENLKFACIHASSFGINILIEPLNRFDAPGYFLVSNAQASEIISEVGAPNIKLMFDCYHAHRNGCDVIESLNKLYPLIGHIQIAASPDRGAPDHGDLDYERVFEALEKLEHFTPIGAEYRPAEATEDSLGWLHDQKHLSERS